MRFEDERYVRVFTRDTVGWLAMRWESRCVLMAMFRKVDRAGLLDIGEDGIEGLAVALALPLDVVEPGLAGLLKRKTVQQTGTTLVIPKFVEAQECTSSGAQRTREWRARERDVARARALGLDLTPVTHRLPAETERHETAGIGDGERRAVTSGDSVQCCAVPYRSDLRDEENTQRSVLDLEKPEAPASPTTPPSTPTVPLADLEQQASLLKHPEPTASTTAPERDVFEHWLIGWRRVVGGNRPPVLDGKRRARIRARLREGFSVQDLCRACDGMWATPWNIGENPSGKTYTDIELVCRDASHVERFIGGAPSREADPETTATSAEPFKGVPAPEGFAEVVARSMEAARQNMLPAAFREAVAAVKPTAQTGTT